MPKTVLVMILALTLIFPGAGFAENDAEQAVVTSVYDEASDRTVCTLTLKDSAQFLNGDPMTAEDVLFTVYLRLDPSCAEMSQLYQYPIVGLDSWLRQIDEERLSAAEAAMAGMQAAGREYVPTAEDGWTAEQQETYWTLTDAYAAACEAEWPRCAQAVVDTVSGWLTPDSIGAFGMTPEQISASEGLRIAYTMLRTGYAFCEDGMSLTSLHSRTVWALNDGIVPTLDDMIAELKLVYGEDAGLFWKAEHLGDYEPSFPDVKNTMIDLLTGGTTDEVTSISGVRLVDDRTVEITLEGNVPNAGSGLFGIPVMSLSAYGDPDLWNPDEGLYGHPRGDISAVDAAYLADGGSAVGMPVPDAGTFFIPD